MKELTSRRRTQGFTITELIVVVTISGILSIALVGVVVVWIQQYAAASLRNSMLGDIQTASHKISDDIRKSTKLLTNNSTPDPYAPSVAGQWASSSNTLVLAQTPRNSSGAGLYDDATNFSGTPDSVIYYLNGQTLYRRIVPANYTGNVNLPLITCTVTTNGGCPQDLKVLDNVASLAFVFLDSSGNTTTDPAVATAVSLTIKAQKTLANQPVSAQDTTVMAFRKGSTATGGSTNAAFAAGYGGISNVNGSMVVPNGQSIYSHAGLTLPFSQSLNTSSNPFGNVYVANRGCGTGANYGSSCAPAQPINISNSGSIYANNICATDQTAGSGSWGVLQTISLPCTAPLLDLPLFNKAALVTKMTNTPQGSQTCNAAPGSCNVTLPANTTFNGNIGGGNAVLNLTLTGSIYVTGTFGNIASGGINQPTTITVADSVTTTPIVVVNGRIGMAWTTIKKNSSGIAPVFISFYAADSACSQNTTCAASPQIVYNTLQQENPVFNTYALSTACGGCTQEASFYAYYGTLDIGNQTIIRGNLAGQKIILDNGLSTIYLNANSWPSS